MAQHENLVSLLVYCVYDGLRLLIYYYMQNESLDYWLPENLNDSSQHDQPLRLKIAFGAGRVLAYIHKICEPHVLHRDIKSSNILLDENFEANASNFGLSKLILPYETHVTLELVETLGYIPPKYGQLLLDHRLLLSLPKLNPHRVEFTRFSETATVDLLSSSIFVALLFTSVLHSWSNRNQQTWSINYSLARLVDQHHKLKVSLPPLEEA
ncbi:tyrosine-sulfated glycopeptide receptor 1-like [Spinacia oleracea]|uniref:non-specific serine/threonine protein kinase n=1 Tax=Spinacia oleracea TaxID=3562 RepID=A0ABM3RH93_SPIOL|nr:tyrosine-sulfated glycopeptide receptor 1-like [Spinacia oleracea]